MTIGIISHRDCILHDPGFLHVECPDRIVTIETALRAYPFKKPVHFYEAPLATQDQLYLAHEKKYVDWIFSIAPKKGEVMIDPDTIMNPFTLNAALRAAGAVVFAVDFIMQKKLHAAFCNVRPPGHHAERQRAMGFCFFNNLAVGIMHALNHYGLKRIAIIDFDVHHGNGTQNIFQHDARVLLCSSFEHPFYPGYDPSMDNEHILCVPLPAGTSGEVYREQVAKAWFAKVRAFKPECIFFSAGFDAHVNDPLADLSLTKEDYVWLTKEIAKIAQDCCDGKMISVLEGGYDLAALAECVPAHVDALA